MEKLLTDMFVLSVPVLEKILRTIIVYFFLIVGLRLAGKRELAQLNPFDLIVILLLSNTVQNAIIGDDNSVTGGLIGAGTLLAVNYLVNWFLYRHEKAQHIFEGQPEVLIEHGKIKTGKLKEEFITFEELERAAREQGYASLDEIESAILEPNGAISFVPKEPPLASIRHNELIERLERIDKNIAALRAALGKN